MVFFFQYGSDFFPDGKSFISIEWTSQFLLHFYTWIASQFLLPVDVLHLWILIGWITSGIAVYWCMRRFGANIAGSLIAGILVQMMPAFRWFAVNHINYMFIATAMVPAALVLHTLTQIAHRPSARYLTYAGFTHFLLLVLDGYIGYFAVLLTIVGIGISATFPGQIRKHRVRRLIVALALFIGLLLSGRIFAHFNQGNAARTLRTYIGGVDSNIRTLVNPIPDIGFGNLSPFVGWPIIAVLLVGWIGAHKARLPLALGLFLCVCTAFSLSITTWSWSFPLDVLGNFIPRFRYYDRYAVLISTLIIATAIGTATRRTSDKISSVLFIVTGLAVAGVTANLTNLTCCGGRSTPVSGRR
jgi:hypothetical protein